MNDKKYQYTCKDCGKRFEIEESEAEWYNNRGFVLPKRCPVCRKTRRIKREQEHNK